MVGNIIHQFDTLTSTNDFAIYIIAKNKPSPGTVISTDYQSNGKGQYGRTWQGMACLSVLNSIILYPIFLKPKQNFFLSMVSALAVRDTIVHFLPKNKKISIKWPNDIYVENKKIAGILIQNSINSTSILSSVLGIGINCFQKEFSEELNNPTSIFIENKEINSSIFEIQKILFENIEKYYTSLQYGQYEQLLSQFQSFLYKRNTLSRFVKIPSNEIFYAKILGIEPSGTLLLQENTTIKKYQMGEIRMVIE